MTSARIAKMASRLFKVSVALSLAISASAETGSYSLSEKDKREVIRDVIKYELTGTGMLKPGVTLYLNQDNINPDWVRDLISDKFILLTPSAIRERQLNKQFDYVELSKIEVTQARVRISLEGPGRGVTYEYKKRRGRWIFGQVHGYYIHT